MLLWGGSASHDSNILFRRICPALSGVKKKVLVAAKSSRDFRLFKWGSTQSLKLDKEKAHED